LGKINWRCASAGLVRPRGAAVVPGYWQVVALDCDPAEVSSGFAAVLVLR
jgi:hypothetical protein